MINLNFKNWFLNEVTFSGGKYAGINHVDVPTYYLLYLAVNFFNGEKIDFYSEQDIKDILNEIQKRKDSGNAGTISNKDKEFYDKFNSDVIMDKVKAVKRKKPSVSAPTVTPRTVTPAAISSITPPIISAAPVPDSREWFLAKVIEDYAGMGKGTFVAVSKSMVDPTNFEYIKVDDPSISGIIPLAMAKRHLASERKENGEVVKINKPKEGVIDPATRLKTAMSQHTKDDIKEKKTDEKTGQYILQKLDAPENAEQKAIDERFAQILRTGEKSHIVLNALAGSGKTTMLNHLAWKYGAPGQKWLYLVFNKKNRYEASTKFPSWVDVQTTNSFLGGKQVLGRIENKRIVGGTRIASIVAGKNNIEKLTMLADTTACSNFIKSLNLPDVKLATRKEMTYSTKRSGPKTTSYPTEGYVKQYLNAIKRDAIKMTEIAKAYALDPREKDCEPKIKEIMNKNFWANQRRTMAMKGFLDKGAFYDQVIKLGLIDSRPTKISELEWEENDKDATYKIAMWLLKNSLPKEKLEFITIGTEKVNLGELRDFADDLWFTSLFANEIHWPKYDVILADEVQDFSESQKIMLNKLAEQGAIVVAVGDPAQSIYKFRGADHLAFNNLKEMLTGISEDKNVEKTLTRNFRSKRAILDFVNDTTIVNNLKVGKKYDPSEEGEVTTNKYDTKDSIELISKERLANKADPKNKILQTAFISRSGLPISAIAGRLMEKSIPYVIFGYDAVDDVKKAVYKYCGGKEKINGVQIYELPNLIDQYYEKVGTKYAGKAAANKVLEEERKTSSLIGDTLQAFERSVGYEKTVGGYLKWMENVCGGINVEDMTQEEKEKLDKKLEDKGVVVLTTAHRSKGFEFDRVFILNPGMFGAKPKKRDPEISDEAHDSDNIQEDNMKYVAYTRAIDQLHLMKKDEDEEAEKKSSMEDEEAEDGVDIDLL